MSGLIPKTLGFCSWRHPIGAQSSSCLTSRQRWKRWWEFPQSIDHLWWCITEMHQVFDADNFRIVTLSKSEKRRSIMLLNSEWRYEYCHNIHEALLALTSFMYSNWSAILYDDSSGKNNLALLNSVWESRAVHRQRSWIRARSSYASRYIRISNIRRIQWSKSSYSCSISKVYGEQE